MLDKTFQFSEICSVHFSKTWLWVFSEGRGHSLGDKMKTTKPSFGFLLGEPIVTNLRDKVKTNATFNVLS